MKEEQKEENANFEGNYNQFYIKLSLNFAQSLQILVINTDTLQSFYQTINDDDILEAQNLRYFEDAADLYDQIISNFSKLIILKGRLEIQYSFGKTKMKKKIITINLVRQEMVPFEIVQAKIIKMKDDYQSEILQKNKLIATLENQLYKSQIGYQKDQTSFRLSNTSKMKCRHPQNIKIQYISQKDKYELLHEKYMQQMIKITELQQQIQRYKATNQINLQQRVSVYSQQCLLLKSLRQSFIIQNITLFDHHPSNSHQKFFNLAKIDSNTMSLTYTGYAKPPRYYNFMNIFEILPNKRMKYFIKVNKIKSKGCFVGFSTDYGFGNYNNHRSRQSVYLKFDEQPSLWQGGYSSNGYKLKSFNKLQKVQCFVDFASNKVIWSHSNRNVIAQIEIPIQMQNKSVYLSILLNGHKDELQISV